MVIHVRSCHVRGCNVLSFSFILGVSQLLHQLPHNYIRFKISNYPGITVLGKWDTQLTGVNTLMIKFPGKNLE